MIWLAASIFCNKSNWHKLLNDGILPFISTEHDIINYTFSFNYLSGENIRLSLLTSQHNAPSLSKNMDNYFKAYFSKANLSRETIELPVNGIFIPFSANSIQYGLYPPVKITPSEKESYKMSIILSEVLCKALKDNIIDNETILTFAYYLKMGLIKTLTFVDPQFLNNLKPSDKFPNGASDEINPLAFEDSKETLIEVAMDIFQPTSETDIPEWFQDWLDGCKYFVNKNKLDLHTAFGEISTIINKHLALPIKMNNMLSHFIERVLFYEDVLAK